MIDFVLFEKKKKKDFLTTGWVFLIVDFLTKLLPNESTYLNKSLVCFKKGLEF